MKIWCCTCFLDVEARLSSGAEVYSHRKDLSSIPYWVCDECKNFVGCHHKTKDRTSPLGVIASKEIKSARMHIHALIDPFWRSGKIKRGDIYSGITRLIGYQFHAAEIRTIEDARIIYKAATKVLFELRGY